MGSQSAVEEELQRILKVSGIESSPIDPSSMEFLRQLVQKKPKSSAASLQTRTSWSSSAVGKQKNVTSSNNIAKPAAAAAATSSTNIDSGANSNPNNALAKSDVAMILEQVKMQTSLILSLQDKIQVLTDKVKAMEGRGRSFASTSANSMEQEQQQRQQQQEEDARAGRVRIIRREVHVIPPPGQAAEIAPRRNGIFGNRVDLAVPMGPRELQPNAFACFFETTRLFWVLSRDYVRPIDGALLFKLVFMTTVVMARVSKHSSKKDKDPRIMLVGALLMMGFLFHTRYIQYVYQFLWKQNVPGRVWKGEQNIIIPPPDQDEDPNNNWNNNDNNARREIQRPRRPDPIPPRLRLPNNDNNNNQGEEEQQLQPNVVHRHWWQQHDLLVGGVAPLENNVEGQAANPIAAVLHGIYYLVGSFVFSIFPMWNPQGHQQRRPLVEGRLDEAGAGRDERRIPLMQAPRDAMEAADDDDSDSGGEQE